MKRIAVVVAMAVAAASCNRVHPGAVPVGAGAELTQLANNGARLTYQATYRYTTSGQLAPGVATRLQIIQRPPASVRKLETSTPGPDGRPLTVRSWQATDAKGSYSCTDYLGLGTRCLPNALPVSTFHSAQLDELFDAPRRNGYFANIARAAARARIAGQVTTCFQATPAGTSGTVLYELCYTSDGILLRARRTVAASVPGNVDARREAVAEAITVERSVSPADLRLPGAVVNPADLRR